MNLNDINARLSCYVWAEAAGVDSQSLIRNKDIAFLRHSSGNTYLLMFGTKAVRAKLYEDVDDISLQAVNHYLGRGCTCLAQAEACDDNNRLRLKLVMFPGGTAEPGNVEIGLSENSIRSLSNSKTDIKELASMCQLKAGSDNYFIIRTGGETSEDFPDDNENEQTDSQPLKTFQIYGSSVIISVCRRKLSDREIFFARRTAFRTPRLKGTVILAHGDLSFTEFNEAAEIKALAAQAIERLTNLPDSYLNWCEGYVAIERRRAVERVHQAGLMTITGHERVNDYVRIFAAGIDPEAITKGDSVEFADEVPEYLSMSVEEHSAWLEGEARKQKSDRVKVYEVVNVNAKYLDVNAPEVPGKYMLLSSRGAGVMQDRRNDAMALIRSGNAANPNLGLILEDKGEIPPCRKVQRIKPLTPMLEGKIFSHPPTERQREAVDIALNTPDIALIQGPPGTGKTTVITAIIERLNQEFDKKGITRGQVLVSAFQHDAVANIVGRLRVNSLPAYKFGRKRSGIDEDNVSVSEEEIERWCRELAQGIRAKTPRISRVRDADELNELMNAYCSSPSSSGALSLMIKCLDIPGVKSSHELSGTISAIIDSLRESGREHDTPAIVRKVYALRCSPESFGDDGPDKALDLYDELDVMGFDDSHVMDVLRSAAMNKATPELLRELAGVRVQLLSDTRIKPPSETYSREKVRKDVIEAAKKAAQLITARRDTFTQREQALSEFLLDIENNPEGIVEAVKDYQFVYSATVQQSMGSDIYAQFKRSGNRFNEAEVNGIKISFPVYDTVIIDEAARAAPMDLFIPMVQGEKRIILVGDQRQLPNIVDESIASSLENDSALSDEVKQGMKDSVFERLFRRMKLLEKTDGIKRTVTLDSQYRMNPVLGDFVSRNFYDDYGEGFKSPLGAELFAYDINGLNGKPAVWLDVPVSKGTEGKQGVSRVRRAEAEIIADYVARWLNDDSSRRYTFGVISFYAAQRDMINDSLSKRGIKEPPSRLQVGTVDAFQGKEFDIVILSAVRTGTRSKSAAGTFGHLMNPNRLCVSMSRQKRALIIAGASEVFNSEFARVNVPAMYNFYRLCESEGVILNA